VTAVVRLLVRIYTVLARLYPHSFCAEFEHEMQAIFAESGNCRRRILLHALPASVAASDGATTGSRPLPDGIGIGGSARWSDRV